MPRPVDEVARQETLNNIKIIARRQMQESGTAGISLRGIARDLGMTAPALYNYYPRLEDLITALIVDAFDGLGNAVEQAMQAENNPSKQLFAGAWAYREWANANKTDFQLIYGNPIPNYEAPREVTVPLATRPLIQFYFGLMAAYDGELLHLPDEYANVPESIADYVQSYLYPLYPETENYPISLFYLMSLLWTRIHGVVMLEIFGHLAPTIGDVDSFFREEVRGFLSSIGLTET